MTEVGAVDADRLAVWQHAHVLPDNLIVAEAWPPVSLALTDELLHRAADRRLEERLARHRVEVGHRACAFFAELLKPEDFM
eukprot:CAMPEP_0185609856 /NCGR_PEP_ID=MMETSP0436-20130131/10940_1 /TAXON_ID=626734 ORGANISM="Favella taraikaensis, Strain Fe Narragansett Bay" /NCGR_SAMPLE_ID=MMETSP0436 /ASSEMBLY_ACC=CAM_ASM_000390 /LENGTH=80 /DNA_ID=CAMNT_0028242343 /DNA_START=173 /DNA_END=415 /DNA_ORIENTATION=-